MNKKKFIADMLKVCKEHKVEVLLEEHVQNEYFSHTITVKRPKPLKKKVSKFDVEDFILKATHISKKEVITDISKIDDAMKGGFKHEKLNMFMGMENCGKSMLKDKLDKR